MPKMEASIMLRAAMLSKEAPLHVATQLVLLCTTHRTKYPCLLTKSHMVVCGKKG